MSTEKALSLLAQELRKYVDSKDGDIASQIKSVEQRVVELNELLNSIPAGPAGKDASADEVAKHLLADEEFKLSLQGLDGVGIKAFKVADTGNLFVVMTNDEELDLGNFTGAKGPQGEQGLQGEKGEKGDDGQSVTVDEVATALRLDDEFIKSVKGDKGDTGLTGETGPMGPQGEQGPQGEKGLDGKDGAEGLSIKSFILEDGYLSVEMTDDQIVDLGCIKGEDGKDFNVEEFYARFKSDSDLIESLKVSPEVIKSHLDILFETANSNYNGQLEKALEDTQARIAEHLERLESLQEEVEATKAVAVEEAEEATNELIEMSKAAVAEQITEFDLAIAAAKTKQIQLEMAIEEANRGKVHTYEPEVITKAGQWVEHNGRFYVANRDTDSTPGDSTAYSLVLRGFEFKKAWNPDTNYERLDVVISSSGSAWVANKNAPSGEPGTTPDWNLLVKRGERGAKGDVGEQGIQGEKGQDGVSIVATDFNLEDDTLTITKSDGSVDELHIPLTELTKDLVDGYWTAKTDDYELPINDFRGIWQGFKEYRRGDVVYFNDKIWIAKKDTTKGIAPEETFDDKKRAVSIDEWHLFLAGSGGGGGGGTTPLTGWPAPVIQNLDMNGFSIDHVSVGTTPGSLVNKGYVDIKAPGIFTFTNTAGLMAAAGTSVADKLTSAVGTPKLGMLVFVGFSTATGADNSQAGLWKYDGTHWTRIILGSSGGASGGSAGASVKTTTAAVVSASGADPIAGLKAGFATIFGAAPATGEIVLISGGTGATAAFNGTYIFDGTKWHLMSTDLSGFINGAVKNKAADRDPVITSFPTGSIVTTLEKDKKEIRVKDAAGNLIVVYSESDVMGKIAASRTFKGTSIEAGATRTGSIATNAMKAEDALTAEDLGSYWVYVGTAGHTIAVNDMGGKKSAIDGLQFQSGDWIMVANVGTTATPKYQYVLIHGDNIGRAQADGLFGHNAWTAGAYEAGTIVRHRASGADPIHYYKASSAIISTDPAPGATVPSTAPAGYGSAWQIVVDDPPAVGTHIGVRVTIEGMAPVVIDYTSVVGDVGPAVTADSFRTALLADPLIAASITIQHVPAGSGNLLLMSKTVSFLVDAGVHTTPNLVMAPLPGINKWVDITPIPLLKDLLDVDLDTTAPANGDSLIYNGTTGVWEPKQVGQPMVYYGDADFDSVNVDAAHNYGMSANTRPDPTIWTPTVGDLYINTLTGVITQLTGAGGTTDPTTRRSGGVMGGTSSVLDVAIEKPNYVGDVKQSCLTESQFIAELGADAGKWVLADGRAVVGTRFTTITGQSNVPDLRGGSINTFIKVND